MGKKTPQERLVAALAAMAPDERAAAVDKAQAALLQRDVATFAGRYGLIVESTIWMALDAADNGSIWDSVLHATDPLDNDGPGKVYTEYTDADDRLAYSAVLDADFDAVAPGLVFRGHVVTFRLEADIRELTDRERAQLAQERQAADARKVAREVMAGSIEAVAPLGDTPVIAG
jgi:hypothetical protein